ncbi:MAG: DHH family phosphoesterase [Planctomycetota bacterium]|jgi:phosphoesterase RecJ-like protein
MLRPEDLEKLRKVYDLIEEAGTVVLVSHVNADGDAVGSLAAMHSWLSEKGKKVTAFLFEAIASRYVFLEFDRHFTIFDPHNKAQRDEILNSDLLLALDLATMDRIPGWSDILSRYEGQIVVIDHHPDPESTFGDINIINWKASATAELLYSLIRMDKDEISAYQGKALFTAIATDTGWFRYTNTQPETLALSAKLLETGIEPATIFGHIYQRNPLKHIRFTGKLVHEARSALDGRLLWVRLSQDALQESDLDRWENEDLLDLLRSVKECRCVALFREEGNGIIRVNLRSKGNLNINTVAERFGGGGHRKAAGITLRDTTLADAEKKVVDAILEFLNNESSHD